MNAILKYPGAKWRIAKWIIDHFPEHKVYCEPFFGSGAIFFNKEPAIIETVNDINNDIVNLFKVCREHAAELAALIYLTPDARAEFNDCYERSTDNIEQARRTLVRYWQSFGTCNSSVNSWRNSQTSGSPRIPQQWDQLPEIIISTLDRLKSVQIENYNAIELIKRYNSSETLLYIDPPYLQSLRKHNMYKNEMTDNQHIELLNVLKESKSKIIISAYDNEMYNTELADWQTDELPTTAQMGIKRTEKIYFNYSLQMSMFDFNVGRQSLGI